MDALHIAHVKNIRLLQRVRSPGASPASADARGSYAFVPGLVYSGDLHLTPHHLIFEYSVPTATDAPEVPEYASTESPNGAPSALGDASTGKNELWIALNLLHSLTRFPSNSLGTHTPVVIRTRSCDLYEIAFANALEADQAWESIKGLCEGVSATELREAFAFCYNNERQDIRDLLPQILSAQVPTPARSDVRRTFKAPSAMWNIYEPEREFARMGVLTRTNAWRISLINKDFEFCSSYPDRIVVPAKISDTTLSYAVKFRSKGRIPGLVYLHWANLGSITRSSQPMTGLTNARSIQDEKLIEAIFTSHSQHSVTHPQGRTPSRGPSSSLSQSSSSDRSPPAGQAPPSGQPSTGQASFPDQLSADAPPRVYYGAQALNVIIDARPTTNAVANSVKGAGTENMDHYRNAAKAYLGIDNIHTMRASLNGVLEALQASELPGALVDPTALRKTGWLRHISHILEGILIITRTVHLSNSHVLVHCSDGWDRTSQLSALAQLCLDPYYRTAEGLAVLIEKDWVSYGHRFCDRSGHLCGDRVRFDVAATGHTELSPTGPVDDWLPAADSRSPAAGPGFIASFQRQFAGSSSALKETCPVFQQFCDCIYQIMQQFPERFEFNEFLLRHLVRECYESRFGTFLFNSEKQRRAYSADTTTRSVWESVFDREGETLTLKKQFCNATYEDPRDSESVLFVRAKEVRWWWQFFGRANTEMNAESYAPRAAKTGSGAVASPAAAHPTTAPSGYSAGTPESESQDTPYLSSALGAKGEDDPAQYFVAQASDAAAAVQKLGWGAWKSMQSRYKDALNQYGNREDESSPPTIGRKNQSISLNDDDDLMKATILSKRISNLNLGGAEEKQLPQPVATLPEPSVSLPEAVPFENPWGREDLFNDLALTPETGLGVTGTKRALEVAPAPPKTPTPARHEMDDDGDLLESPMSDPIPTQVYPSDDGSSVASNGDTFDLDAKPQPPHTDPLGVGFI